LKASREALLAFTLVSCVAYSLTLKMEAMCSSVHLIIRLLRRILHSGESHNLYSAPNVIRIIKEAEMGEAKVINRREQKCTKKYMPENLKSRNHLVDLGLP
jgi:hypothetical protein